MTMRDERKLASFVWNGHPSCPVALIPAEAMEGGLPSELVLDMWVFGGWLLIMCVLLFVGG